jgi:tetratricopeptide (TPR) repeat protein
MRLMQGVALLATGQRAPQEVFDQTGPLAPHAALWRAVALSQAERYPAAIKAWPTRRGILPTYPSYLRELVQERQVAALVNAGDKEAARATVDALVAGYPSDEPVPLALIRWQGIARLGTKDEAEGMRLIAKAAEDMHDPATAYRAKYDFVTNLMDKGLLSNDQAIRYLTNLWMDWRGDTLERDTMKVLADLYDREDKPREALTLWQTLVKAFPTMPGMDEIARRMTTTFTRAFDPENPRVYDALTYMGLYYDFRELVPNNALGDAVQEQMATLLNRAMLYSRSVPILEQQLNLRPLDPAAQGRLVLLLAEAYLNLGRGGDALQLLDNWEKVATTTTLKEQWKVEETRILTALNRPQAAEKALKGTPLPEANAEARDALVEAFWASGDFSSSVPLLKAQLAGLKTADIVSSTAAQLALFRLGFAYSQLHEGDKLDALNTSYAEALTKLPMVSDGLGAVAASSSLSATVPTGGPLAPISTALNDLNALTVNVKLTRADVQQHNESIQEFDKKMRYMELLPPPAI